MAIPYIVCCNNPTEKWQGMSEFYSKQDLQVQEWAHLVHKLQLYLLVLEEESRVHEDPQIAQHLRKTCSVKSHLSRSQKVQMPKPFHFSKGELELICLLPEPPKHWVNICIDTTCSSKGRDVQYKHTDDTASCAVRWLSQWFHVDIKKGNNERTDLWGTQHCRDLWLDSSSSSNKWKWPQRKDENHCKKVPHFQPSKLVQHIQL